jgi:DNA-binding LacI/PurR family transcriptional regulator
LVPDALSAVGFDDIKISRYLTPALTTVAQPMREIGQMCVRLILRMLSGQAKAPISVTLPHELKIRSTTAPPDGTRSSLRRGVVGSSGARNGR